MTITDDRPTTGTSTGTRMLRIDSFSVYDTSLPFDADSTPGTSFDRSGDLCMQLRKGGVTTSDNIAGGAVAVMLDIDGGHHSEVVVDSGRGAGSDQETLVEAITHLTRALDQLRRLYGRSAWVVTPARFVRWTR